MNPMYAAMKGTAMKDKKKRAGGGGGGGTASVSVATSATGNYDNAVELVFVNAALPPTDPQNFSGGILGGAQSTFGTASSPTRTTQTIFLPVATYHNSGTINGQGQAPILIGGYIRSNNFTSANKTAWTVAANTIQSQSFATGAAVIVTETDATRKNFPDNTFGTSVTGIYNAAGHSTASGTGFYGITIQHAVGRGAATFPQAGDSFTFRLEVEDQDTSNTYSAVHDVTVNFV